MYRAKLILLDWPAARVCRPRDQSRPGLAAARVAVRNVAARPEFDFASLVSHSSDMARNAAYDACHLAAERRPSGHPREREQRDDQRVFGHALGS